MNVMTSPKPIKRSPQLAPLSREHHDGLMFVWNLRQGLKNGTSNDELRKYILWFWTNHIKPHFFQEGKNFLKSSDKKTLQQILSGKKK